MPFKRDFMMFTNRVTFHLLLPLCLFVSACNGIRVNTNAEEYIIGEVGASTVEVYSPSELYNHENEPLGEVFTSFCSDSADALRYPTPSINTLQKNLQIQTANKGGNALILTECGELKYPACSIYLECTGLAYYLKSWD